MRRILVTGGAGFIGSHLCTWLVEHGNHVICLDNFYTGHLDNVAQLQPGAHAHRFELVRHDVVDSCCAEVDEIARTLDYFRGLLTVRSTNGRSTSAHASVAVQPD
jgi:nucleoside-diphosphate-sugar epimerase